MTGMVSLEAMSGAVSHVRREYSESYSIGLLNGSYGAGGVFEASAGDGARFEIVVDRYGQAYRACDRQDCRREGTPRPPAGAGDYLCDQHAAEQTVQAGASR